MMGNPQRGVDAVASALVLLDDTAINQLTDCTGWFP